MSVVLVTMQLLLLHSTDGRDIDINPAEITSMYQPGSQVHEKVNCIINLSDGKFVSVVERCDVIEKRIEELKTNGR